jgi:hypothetical protein
MAFQKTYSDAEIRSFRKKDNEVMLECIFKGLSVIREGSGQVPTKEEISDWFNWIKEKAEPEQDTDGMWYGGNWYSLSPSEAKQLYESLEPFKS